MKHQLRITVQTIVIGAALCFPYKGIVNTAAADTSLNKSTTETSVTERRAKAARKGHGQSPANKRAVREAPENAETSAGKEHGQSPANKPTSMNRQEESTAGVNKGEGQSPGPQ